MRTVLGWTLAWAGLLLLAGASGCAGSKRPDAPEAQAVSDEEVRAVGFLDPPPAFEPGNKEFERVYVRPGVDFSAYDKVLLEPVVFFLKGEARDEGLHPEELKQLSDAFNRAVAEALGSAYPLVDKPGPGVMRVRTAITGLVPNRPVESALLAIAPGGSLAYAVLPKRYNNLGSASMEAEVLDSLTGERLAAAVDRRDGKKTEIFEGLKTWGHVDKAFAVWAGAFRLWLDETHGKAAAGPASPLQGS